MNIWLQCLYLLELPINPKNLLKIKQLKDKIQQTKKKKYKILKQKSETKKEISKFLKKSKNFGQHIKVQKIFTIIL